MKILRWIKLKWLANRGNISVMPYNRKKGNAKVCLVEDIQYYLWEIKNNKRLPDIEKIKTNLSFLENVKTFWKDYIREVPISELWNLRISVSEGLEDYYRYLDQMTIERTSKQIENELKKAESIKDEQE